MSHMRLKAIYVLVQCINERKLGVNIEDKPSTTQKNCPDKSTHSYELSSVQFSAKKKQFQF